MGSCTQCGNFFLGTHKGEEEEKEKEKKKWPSATFFFLFLFLLLPLPLGGEILAQRFPSPVSELGKESFLLALLHFLILFDLFFLLELVLLFEFPCFLFELSFPFLAQPFLAAATPGSNIREPQLPQTLYQCLR
jgi:hypothetical protein